MIVGQFLVLDGTITTVVDGAVDAYNTPTDVTSTSQVRCWLMQRQRGESTADANQQSEEVAIYLPAGTAVTGRDRITVAGLTYEVQGPPWNAANPLHGGADSFVEVSARRVA